MAFINRIYPLYSVKLLKVVVKKIRYIPINICISVLILGTSCEAQEKKSSPAHYNLNAPEIIKLPNKINQISGMAYYKPDSSVFAIDDDHGNLYKISLEKNPKVEMWEFGKDKDYEDIVLLNNNFYILNSHGKIVFFPFSFPIQKTQKAELKINGSNEFESLYADMKNNRLIMMCKNCVDDKKDEVSSYAFDLSANSFISKPVLVLNKKEIEKKLGKSIPRFKPSAANINPVTNEVYIISSINKLLVVADKNMTVKEVYPLDPQLFKQPEGLCFTSSGDLLISNEYAKEGKATILFYKYH